MRDTKDYSSKTLKGRNLAWLVATLILDFLILLVLAFQTAIEDLSPTRLAAIRAPVRRHRAQPRGLVQLPHQRRRHLRAFQRAEQSRGVEAVAAASGARALVLRRQPRQ